MNDFRIVVSCDDSFHDGEKPQLRTFTRLTGEWLIADFTDELVVDDKPVSPVGPHLTTAEARERRRIDCECGASLVMRHEKLEPLLTAMADGGVSGISLARLNLLVSTLR